MKKPPCKRSVINKSNSGEGFTKYKPIYKKAPQRYKEKTHSRSFLRYKNRLDVSRQVKYACTGCAKKRAVIPEKL